MDEIEVPLEQAHEHLHEAAHHAEGRDRWISFAALGSGIIAALTAVVAMIAGAKANEAMILQIRAANSWSYYQAKGVKAAVLKSKVDLLNEMGREPRVADQDKLKQYQEDQDQISEKAKDFEKEAEHNLVQHETYARGVTLFQVSIALGAIAVLSRRRKFWYVSLGFAAVGLIFSLLGFAK